jgi:hypothetical protein
VILVWGQDLRPGGSTPQFAGVVECPGGRAVQEYVQSVVEGLIRLVQAVDPAVVTDGLAICDGEHLGIPVSHVPLGDYAKKSKLPFMSLLQNVEPAWAVSNNWLIVALSRDHVERLLDAQFGLVPTLAAVPDVQSLRGHQTSRAALSITQAGLATDVLDRWLAAHRSGSASLLDPVWWQSEPQSTTARRPRLGIGMRIVQDPGVVTVARVYPKTAAEGRLQPDDRILGIDGQLLSLASPNADLRRRWAQSTTEPGPTLRVERNATAMDVVLPKEQTREPPVSLVNLQPADAVRELASLGRAIPFASYVVYASDKDSYAAMLSLRLIPEHASKTTTHK